MNKQLRRILDLVRRTGDRMIVTDPEGEDAYVVMGLPQYEALLSGRGAVAASTPSTPKSSVSSQPSDIWEALPPAGSQAETWDLGKLNPEEQMDLEAQYQAYLQEKDPKKSVDVAKSPSPKAETVIPKQKEEEFGEEQFYLEPIE
ncbi:MAG: hypothetical protein UY77_C0024G0011 [Candidatus Uhrbacteria bacterium GW2011_GWA2_53_10]|uniref:Uncharacterized protein n=1 Tax=Candidatus Uhrbacteria bacterium GW2011_GWA2_53_10 TaxID=1618980 RepID=A0A0G1ZVP6_9BACT|nr:MAG: hypothetical protein UY77_C0024G0011 [Candidatus Uhrbacteria bacterium GW2011_GWA2_53_10]